MTVGVFDQIKELPKIIEWNELHLRMIENRNAIVAKIRKIEINGVIDPRRREYLLRKLRYDLKCVKIALKRHYNRQPSVF